MNTCLRKRIRINGIVQGVGFRPFVYRLARELDLSGFVNNSSDGLLIEIEGPPERLETFNGRLWRQAPALARIMESIEEDLEPLDRPGFTIRATAAEAPPITLISPDVTVCDRCLEEMFDPEDRRHRYPFINCTGCGPRYTITRSIPYDRPNTSMAVFPMCPACQAEYDDPADRRFHAQPNACPACGPQLVLCDRAGARIRDLDAVREASGRLGDGAIIAVRGLGGFHLAVDGLRDEAVRELRRRKRRLYKPFALMASSIDDIRRYCHVSAEEEAQLTGPRRPIVLLRARDVGGVAPSVAPGTRELGFMLPSTPLHHLLLRDGPPVLVMTSGNLSEEPIAIGNDEALERLGSLADFFLLHDREILQRCDDSILRVEDAAPRLLRRSRGYVPAPVFMRRPSKVPILACGGELKNTVALCRGDMVFISQHIGDLDNPRALDFFEDSINHLSSILELAPQAIAHDLHPEYLSTKWAMRREGLPRIGVQHHHAHLASVLADNRRAGPAIGIILDGTGYGSDGTIWGGEVLVGDAVRFDRHAWLSPLLLPGGETAIRQPWRMALSALHAAYGVHAEDLELPVVAVWDRGQKAIVMRMLERGINSPASSSCGRLFDAVSALLGIRPAIDYEAQAAIELETALDESETGFYEHGLGENGMPGPIPVAPMVQAIVEDIQRRIPVGRISARFHRTLARLFERAALSARDRYGIGLVALSGGVFQNVHLLKYLRSRLERQGLEVLTHRQVPPNDGGLALGQIVVAAARLAED